MKIIEIRIHQRTKSDPVHVTLFFDNHTQSLCETPFEKRFEAEIFVTGIKNGFEWAKRGFLLDENL